MLNTIHEGRKEWSSKTLETSKVKFIQEQNQNSSQEKNRTDQNQTHEVRLKVNTQDNYNRRIINAGGDQSSKLEEVYKTGEFQFEDKRWRNDRKLEQVDPDYTLTSKISER